MEQLVGATLPYLVASAIGGVTAWLFQRVLEHERLLASLRPELTDMRSDLARLEALVQRLIERPSG